MTTPATDPTFDVFISHADKDNAPADLVYNALVAAGLTVFTDHHDLESGDRWEKKIHAALITSKAGLILLSKNSLKSVQCEGERQYLFSKYQRGEVRVFVALLENLTPDEIPYAVNAIQYVNLAADFDGQLKVLVSAMLNKLNTPLPKLESKELPPEAPKSTFAEARLLTDPDDLHEAPRKLIGRDEALTALENLIADEKRVVVQAHGGAGKTALAAVFAKNWLETHPGQPALWLRAGSANADALLDAIGQALGQSQAVTAAHGDAKIALVRQLLRGVSLVVVDDVWNDRASTTLVKVIPDKTALLVTSRLRLDALDEIYTLPDLQPLSALELLAYHGGAHLKTDPDAPALVELLGELAFAVEIAGRTLMRTKETVGDLLKRIKTAPHELQTNSPEERRENVAALIDASLQTLDDKARAVFMAFGAFFAPQVTAELMAIYLAGDIDAERITKMREEVSYMVTWSDDEIRQVLASMDGQNPDVSGVQEVLQKLHTSGLVEYIPAKTPRTVDTPDAFFRIHDLSYAYAAAPITLEQRHRAMTACLTYAERYEEPGWDSFRPLLPALDTILGAAEWALNGDHWEQGKSFVYSIEGGSRILTLLGYYGQKIRLLEWYASAAQQRDDQGEHGKALGNLGIAYDSLGDYPRAIQYYEQAVTIQRTIGDKQREGNQLGNLGTAYNSLGDYPRAIQYYEQALAISRTIGNKAAEGSILGNLGNAYSSLGDYPRAIQYHEQALAISRAIGDKRGEGNDLGNLGNAYDNLGDYPRAIQYHEQALAISRTIGNKSAEGSILGNLGIAYNSLGDYTRAIQYHEQALAISRAIGDKRGEGNDLGNLGIAYDNLGDYPRAIQYHELALAIRRAIGDKRGEGNDLGNLGNAYRRLGDYPRTIQYHEQALAISRAIGDKHGEGNDLGNLGNAYDSLGDYPRAIQYYEDALKVFTTIGVAHLTEQTKRLIARTQAKMAGGDQS